MTHDTTCIALVLHMQTQALVVDPQICFTTNPHHLPHLQFVMASIVAIHIPSPGFTTSKKVSLSSCHSQHQLTKLVGCCRYRSFLIHYTYKVLEKAVIQLIDDESLPVSPDTVSADSEPTEESFARKFLAEWICQRVSHNLLRHYKQIDTFG